MHNRPSNNWPNDLNSIKNRLDRKVSHLHDRFESSRYSQNRPAPETYQAPTRKLYRSRDGIILGVCKGVADFLGIPVLWVRIATLLTLIFTGFFPVAAVYIIAGIILSKEPPLTPQNQAENNFYSSYQNSRTSALRNIKSRIDRLHTRVQRMESQVTSQDPTWEERLYR